MELLFTVTYAYPNLVGAGLVLIGTAPAAGTRVPRDREAIELRTPYTGKLAGRYPTTVLEVRAEAPEGSGPLSRAVTVAAESLPKVDTWVGHEVWGRQA